MTNKSPASKKTSQHVVAKGYLLQFAGPPKGHVWTYFKENGIIRDGKPYQTAKRRHFYSMEDADGNWDVRIEDLLSEIESAGLPVLRELIAGRDIKNDADRKALALFIAASLFRTNAMRQLNAERHAWSREAMMRDIASSDEKFNAAIVRLEEVEGKKYSEEQRHGLRQSMRDSSNYIFEVPKERTLEMMLLGMEYAAGIFFRMNWSVGRCQQPVLITSDNPVLQILPPKGQRASETIADETLENPNLQITFPLAPDRLLVMAWRKVPPTGFDLTDRQIAGENRTRIIQAENEVYAYAESEELSALIAELKNEAPRRAALPGPLKSEVRVPK